jgi:serine/threonine protein kinase
MEYIQQCTTNTLVGTGAYGKVYLGKDSELSKPFVVKTILFTHSDQTDVDKRQKEHSTGDIGTCCLVFNSRVV